MFIQETTDFGKDLNKLPEEAKKIFLKQKMLFAEDHFDSRLHVKRIKEFPGVYSFRITRRYRALFYFQGNYAVLFKIGHRKNIYE